MKKFVSMLLICLMVFSLCACGGEDSGGQAADPDALQAGFSRVVCLPDDAVVHIAGNNAAATTSQGILDELAVTCIAFKKGDKTALVYTCDVVDIYSFYTATESVISNATGIPVEDIILNATHTHSAPTLKNNLPGKDAYLQKFNNACADAGTKAIKDLSPVSGLSYGSAQTENMVRVRHYRMNDGTTYGNGHGTDAGQASGYKEHLYAADEECQVIRIARAAEDKKDIVMINLGAHATMNNSNNYRMLSADFPLPARQYVEEQTDSHCAYFIAAAGDQVPNSKLHEVKNEKDYLAYGQQLGEYVVECLNNNMTESQSSGLATYHEVYTAKRMKDGTDDSALMARAREIVSLKNKYGSTSAPEVQAKVTEYGMTSSEASYLLNRASSPETGSFPTNTILLGDMGIVFFPGELLGSHGAQIKNESPTPFTFVITCSEDDQAYFPNAIAKEEGFYEYDISKYAMGTGEACATRYCEILTALKEGTTPAPQVVK